MPPQTVGRGPATELGRLVGGVKSRSVHLAAGRGLRAGRLWQRGYYDHIVRSENDFLRIWTYIDNNPLRWELDCYYTERIEQERRYAARDHAHDAAVPAHEGAAPDCILFFRLGDFYEMFNEDAKLVSKELELTLTSRDRGQAGGAAHPPCAACPTTAPTPTSPG